MRYVDDEVLPDALQLFQLRMFLLQLLEHALELLAGIVQLAAKHAEFVVAAHGQTRLEVAFRELSRVVDDGAEF